jgi:hypothetical protein
MKPLRILVGCESSGTVREAFRKLGHDAWSCDLQPADDGSQYHFQCDVLTVLDKNWDIGIFHPTCTYLANSGVRWLYERGRKGLPLVVNQDRWDKMVDGASFFFKLLNSDIPKIAVENPIMHKHAKAIIGTPHTQIVQPWMFGHPESKATCLWLKGLPKLVPTNDVQAEMKALPKNQAQRLHYLPPSKDRWKLRSKTFQGLANAMAAQWG